MVLSLAFILAFIGSAVALLIGILIFSEVEKEMASTFGADIVVTNESDGEWSWREHKSFSSFPMGVVAQKEIASPNRAQLESVLSGAGNGLGSMYLFKTFPKEVIEGKAINIDWEYEFTFGGSDAPALFQVLDGAYDRTSLVDFPNGANRILKGVGVIDTLEHSGQFGQIEFNANDTLTPDLSSAGNDVTIFVFTSDPQQDTGMIVSVKQIEIVGVESVTFDSNTILSAVGGSGQNEYGTFTATPTFLGTPTFISQVPDSFNQASNIAFTVIGILPVALFFVLFAIFGGRTGE